MAHVYPTTGLTRYQFPTHANDLVYDRADARASEAFIVVLRPGQAPPLHKHDDTEQVFYILKGRGLLRLGKTGRPTPVKAGQVIVVRPGTWHSVRAVGGPLRYLAVDCFGAAARLEPTWDAHVRVLCRQQGWDYSTVVRRPARPAARRGRTGRTARAAAR